MLQVRLVSVLVFKADLDVLGAPPRGLLLFLGGNMGLRACHDAFAALSVSHALADTQVCATHLQQHVGTLFFESCYVVGTRRKWSMEPTPYGSAVLTRSPPLSQVLLNLAASHTSSHAVRDAGIAMVLQSLIHSVTQVRPPSVPS